MERLLCVFSFVFTIRPLSCLRRHSRIWDIVIVLEPSYHVVTKRLLKFEQTKLLTLRNRSVNSINLLFLKVI